MIDDSRLHVDCLVLNDGIPGEPIGNPLFYILSVYFGSKKLFIIFVVERIPFSMSNVLFTKSLG